MAIELAASRVKLLKVDQIKARLEDAFRLLTGGSRTALPRQQTLRGTIDWSYNLLSEEERTVLRDGSPCLLVAGLSKRQNAVCGNEDMLDLLILSWINPWWPSTANTATNQRYYLLETIRQYAREKLAESGEGEQIRRDIWSTLSSWPIGQNQNSMGQDKLNGRKNLKMSMRIRVQHWSGHCKQPKLRSTACSQLCGGRGI